MLSTFRVTVLWQVKVCEECRLRHQDDRYAVGNGSKEHYGDHLRSLSPLKPLHKAQPQPKRSGGEPSYAQIFCAKARDFLRGTGAGVSASAATPASPAAAGRASRGSRGS